LRKHVVSVFLYTDRILLEFLPENHDSVGQRGFKEFYVIFSD